jgi:hypothetical protein
VSASRRKRDINSTSSIESPGSGLPDSTFTGSIFNLGDTMRLRSSYVRCSLPNTGCRQRGELVNTTERGWTVISLAIVGP